MNNEKLPEGVRVLNYKQSTNTVDVSDVPILLKDNILKELQVNDDSPFFKVESIDYPASGTGGVYEKSFFKSFIDVTKNRPIPGSKRGHEYTSRPSSDFYMVGGKMVDNADGKTGTAHFLMYIPKNGDTTDNTGFIRDARAGIVNFSLVTAPEYNVKKDDDGIERRHFTKTNGYERNDAVEYGAGAMAQQVNSRSSIDFEEIKNAIEGSHFDSLKNIDGEIMQDGIVYRSALRRAISRATEENERAELGKLLSMIDKQKNGGKPVELKEAIEMVANAVKNGVVAFADIAKNCGTEKLVKNEGDEKAVVLANALTAKLGDKPMEALDTILAENKANKDATVINTVTKEFGAEKVKNGEKEVDNPAYAYAFAKCNGKTGDALKNEVEALKADPVMLAIRGNSADPNSKMNIVVPGGKTVANVAGDGIPTFNMGGKK